MKKIFLYIIAFVILCSFATAACLESLANNVRAQSFTSMQTDVYQYVTSLEDDERFVSWNSINPTTESVTRACENKTPSNATPSTLEWVFINATGVMIYNRTDITDMKYVEGQNYSVAASTGIITWLNLSPVESGSNVTICYNKTLLTSLDLSDAAYQWSWSSDGNTTYDTELGWAVVTSDLAGTTWATNYNYNGRDCTAEAGCSATKTTIFAGFALLAVMIIAGAAFVIISIFNGGEMHTAALGAFAVAAIGLAIVLFVGYYIIGAVGLSIC